jgi:hypothetical protein
MLVRIVLSRESPACVCCARLCSCKVDANWTCSGEPSTCFGCGDGIVTASIGESCDAGRAVLDPHCTYGLSSCTVCSSLCAEREGVPQRCGDGVVNVPYEGCDTAVSCGAVVAAAGLGCAVSQQSWLHLLPPHQCPLHSPSCTVVYASFCTYAF